MRLLVLVALLPLLALSPRSGRPEGPALTPDADSEAELLLYMREGRRWIGDLRRRHRPAGRALTRAERAAFDGFFDPALLEAARVTMVEAIPNPHFYEIFDASGRDYPIDFHRATALALGDTVIVVESRAREGSAGWLPLLFHELVHHAQLRVLGEEGYYEEYVRGWAANGRAYRAIPIEEQAYELASRFRGQPERRFSVERQVRRRFR